ncbi:hypothetical protein HYDPIDRAFT_34785 [Hydnomerulius pinastri MD-312]|uniref:BTB domain-containing protein n=1 Tax=Hydnomerulius pinastri MD-312 TaxID=994086 RepID=A0A0C9UXM9_9AGAM|nr:hypothetical protein HYDPIDRAFT_34785 [Hydnomerulius pinastri MD-312]
MAHDENAHICYKVPELFFEDGNIVLSAEANSGTHLYKLHKGVLFAHSSVFSDILSLPSTTSAMTDVNEYYESTPVVHLSDNPDDLTSLLKAFYYPSWRRNAQNCVQVLPTLILAQKYMADDIRSAIVSQIEAEWPQNIWQWDSLENESALKPEELRYFAIGPFGGPDEKMPASEWDDYFPEPASAIQLARVADIPSILPAAFYQLSRTRPSDDFDEWRSPEGTQLDPMREFKDDKRTARWSRLSKDDLYRLMLGKEAMSEYASALRATIFNDTKFCSVVCADTWKYAPSLKSDDILADLQELCKPRSSPGALMCERCRMKVNIRGVKERATVWNELKTFFHLV